MTAATTTIPTRPGAVSLAALGDDFGSAFPAEDRLLADRVAHLPALDLTPGRWTPPDGDAPPRAVVVAEGALLRTVTIAGRRFAQVVDAGDVVDPWLAHDGSVPATAGWTALEPTRIALLDQRFDRLAERWPQLLAVLHRRTAEHAARTCVHAAILALPTIEQRVLGVLWHLADRRGTVSAEGVTLRLPVTHAQLGALSGGLRPTTSLALRRLEDAGHVRRLDDGAWRISHESRTLLGEPG